MNYKALIAATALAIGGCYSQQKYERQPAVVETIEGKSLEDAILSEDKELLEKFGVKLLTDEEMAQIRGSPESRRQNQLRQLLDAKRRALYAPKQH